jgi:SNF2 family DNA or RNA helicase
MANRKDYLVLSRITYRGVPRLGIEARYDDKERVKQALGAQWDARAKVWHIAWGAASLDNVRREFGEYHLRGDEHVEALERELDARRDAQGVGDGHELEDLPTRTVGWPHQRRVFHFAKDLRATGLYVDMGGGKSAVAIGLADHWDAKLVLIQCPKSVMGVWPKQFNGDGEDFDGHSTRQWDCWVGNQRSTVVRKAHDLARFLVRRTDRPKCVIINYDAGWRNAMADLLLAQLWDIHLMDESHKVKAPGGKASKFCAQLERRSSRILELTGTPQPHGPEDLYGQFRAMDPSIFGTSFTRFKNRYFETRPINDKVDRIVGFRDERARVEFVAKAASISIVVPRSEFTIGSKRLPPVERQVQLEPATFKVYRSLRDELVAEVEDGIVTADNILVKGLRLKQVTSGFVKTEDGIVASLAGAEKQGLLAEVLDDLPVRSSPVVVFGVFHHDLDSIQKVCLEAGYVYGELSGRRRDGLADDSTMARGIDVLGCQLQSGGVGIDLTRSSTGIYFSVDYNLGNIEQSFSRLDRPGQSNPVTFIHLVSVTPTGGRTVDGITLSALQGRREMNEGLMKQMMMNHLKER